MPCYVCVTCGVQYAETAEPPERCAICDDERQYVGLGGQRWTTLDDLRKRHRALLTEEEPGLTGIGTEPQFAIGQRALLVQTSEGNLLWDCITYLDDSLVAAVRGLGGVRAIAISHPHYYSSMVEWARAFVAPVLLHADDSEWVMRPDERIEHWAGEERELFGGLKLVRLGGHFAGGQVLHWPERRLLLTGDIIQVIPDRAYVSFMYSYPNRSRSTLRRSGVSLPQSSRSNSSVSTAPGSGPWWSATPRPPLGGRPSATSRRSVDKARSRGRAVETVPREELAPPARVRQSRGT